MIHDRTQYFRFFEKFLGSISFKITQKTENDIIGRYRFGWNFDSKLYVRKKIFEPWVKVARLWFGKYENIKIKFFLQ